MKNCIFLGRLVSLVLFCFFLLNPYLLNGAILLDRVIALVNKEVITWSELYRMMEQEATDEMKTLDEAERRNIFKEHEEEFLDRLIDIRLQVQEAKRLGIEASPEDVEEATENIKKKYALTDEALKASLEKEGLTFDEYKERLSEQILISKLVNQQVRGKIVVSDEEIDEFYTKHKDEFVLEESYKLRQIFFKMPESDDMKRDLEEKASDIIERIQNGEDFSHLAQEYSEDPSGKLGGDLGYIQRKFMAKEFIDALSDMSIGDSSMPFWTEQGLNIIKLEDKKAAKTEEALREEIKNRLFEEKFIKSYNSWVKDLRNGARIVIRL
jgi:peptidyl-prolyl cis-trans isomerase SurA